MNRTSFVETPGVESSQRASGNYFSATELAEFKEIILRKIETAKFDYGILVDAVVTVDGRDPLDTKIGKDEEDGHRTLSLSENSELAERQGKFIGKLNSALVRIENRTYGFCTKRDCPCGGRLMSKERLRATPHATKCTASKQETLTPLMRHRKN